MDQREHLQTLSDIKKMMERSSRFISLSGLSGVSAGITAIIGAVIAYSWMHDYYAQWDANGAFSLQAFNSLRLRLISLAGIVLVIALAGGMYFTWRRARKNGLSIWDATARKVVVNMAIPLATGGAFIAALLYNDNHLEPLVAPTCLVFYGLALVNTSKYTLSDVKYLGIAEIILGLLNMFLLRKGIYFWTLGFGVLHILYGIIMWWKYERTGTKD
ncbi:hypothetical protein KTO58_25710 [Chitinophaga pendula]|uniref:hypothetical protein n=1 Tax=Chitinophaga TaxID=79328 RepID=UPI000BAFB497|nr:MULTISPECIES: hypothetical protein [Chitinophaga]ASZ10029.1 hypothetical protein CK934_03065 [Chitinophaga sp. MD30]UCJ07023.1 hypothetical protein KTO58_25710 [Chitinophaga pendula]